MFSRDRSRLRDARTRSMKSPLGAARWPDLFAIGPAMTAKALGFDRPDGKSLDSVADRDFVLETECCAICAVHLSRLAEEIVLLGTPQSALLASRTNFDGSSIMPQSGNPDAGSLIRGQVGPDYRRAQRLPYRDEGPAARLFEGLAEDKEGTFRCTRFRFVWPR